MGLLVPPSPFICQPIPRAGRIDIGERVIETIDVLVPSFRGVAYGSSITRHERGSLMRKLAAVVVITVACASLFWMQRARASNDETEIRQLLDRWAKAFRAHDIDGIMSMYAPEVVAYDVVPPLQYVGADAYRKDYLEFLSQYDGPIDVEFRDLKIVTSDRVAFVYGLERFKGSLKNGQKSELWLRFTCGFRKINGKWLDTHDHVSVPVDLETGRAAVDLKP